MTTATTAPPPAPTGPSPQRLDPLAGVLSFLVPGLGQVYQGRLLKGVVFCVCLYGLFFHGLALGMHRNVWLPEPTRLPEYRLPLVGGTGGVVKAICYRTQFLGQFPIGVVAFPALVQFYLSPPSDPGQLPPPTRFFGRYMQAPTEAELNALNRDSEKLRIDLGWVYTVVAGVLNILVIYDAVAGPAVRRKPKAAEAVAAVLPVAATPATVTIVEGAA